MGSNVIVCRYVLFRGLDMRTACVQPLLSLLHKCVVQMSTYLMCTYMLVGIYTYMHLTDERKKITLKEYIPNYYVYLSGQAQIIRQS